MALKTRRIIFYILTLTFLAAGIVAIFYSNGWRFDWETFSINKLGSIYFQNLPADSAVIIEKTNIKFEPGILNSSLYIANLFPKIYTAKITKTNYQSWNKEIRVKPSLVTEIPPLILLPEKIGFKNPIAEKISDFWLNSKYLIQKSQSNDLFLKNQKIIGQEIISWSSDGYAAISKSGKEYFLIDLKKSPQDAINLTLAFNNLRRNLTKKDSSPIQKIEFHPDNRTKFLMKTGLENQMSGLYILDTQKMELSLLPIKNPDAFSTSGKEIIYSSKNQAFLFNLDSQQSQALNLSPKNGKIARIYVSPSNKFLSFLDENGLLQIFNQSSKQNSIIAHNARLAVFSPDSEKIAFLTANKEIVIHKLKTEKSAQLKQPDDTIILNIGANEGTKFSWHKNSHYLFVKYPEALYLLEGDKFPPINFQLIDSQSQQYGYDQENNQVYLLKNNALYSFEPK